MPNTCCVGYDLRFPRNEPGDPKVPAREFVFRARTLFWYVPIDDHSHLHVMVTVPGSSLLVAAMRADARVPHSVAEQIQDILEGRSTAHRGGGKVPDMVRTQDGVAVVGQGVIADRDREHLGASDAGVVMLRRLYKQELRKLEAGEPLTPYRRPDDLMSLLAVTSATP
jgi:5,5'-dehydrodivanillate O-demethylase